MSRISTRSTPGILAAANGLIAHNRGRIGKALFTEGRAGEAGGGVERLGAQVLVGGKAEQLAREGASLNDMAILVAQFQTRASRSRFVAMACLCRVAGAGFALERRRSAVALAYLRIVTSPNDALAFERIVNVPKRGLGDGDGAMPPVRGAWTCLPAGGARWSRRMR